MEGKFVLAAIPFMEGDGRAKTRPCLILAQKRSNGRAYLLVAPKYSAAHKVRGGNEIVLSGEEAVLVGQDKEGVLRFNKEHLCVVAADDVIRVCGDIASLPPLKQQSIRNAARRIGCLI